MSEERPHEQGGWFVGRFIARSRIRLVGAAGGVLLALLIAPATRRLVLSQAGLTLPFPATVASVGGSEVGLRPDPFERDIAVRAAHAVAERHPNDLQVQLANAVLGEGSNFNSKQKIQQLRALEGRFADRPALYANILRYEALGWVRANHQVEQCDLTGTPPPTKLTQTVDEAEYAAYDRDAAAGERLDPDNAYFPFMRAVGLFGARRDDEALAAIARAARKPQWREYYNEELKGQWRLQDEASINNSALFHSLSAAALLFPQYAQMRGAARVTIYLAMKAEQAGRIDEGLALRKDILRIGSLMRSQAGSLIGPLVGIALAQHAIARPAGALPINETSEKKAEENRAKLRRQFDDYLARVGRTTEMDAFHAEQQADDEVRDLIAHSEGYLRFDQLQSLLVWWFVDLITLSNILWLFVFGGLAVLFLRNRRLQSGQALPGHARLALPLGLIGGALTAPSLLTWLSPYFQNIAAEDRNSMLLMGLAPALFLLAKPAKTGRERKARLGSFGAGLLAGALLNGLYFWQLRGFAAIASLMQVFNNLSGSSSPVGPGGPDLTGAVPWSTACVSLLILIVASIISRACRVPISVGLARAFRGLMAPIAALLFLAYGGMMLTTYRAEAAVQYSLDRAIDNAVQYVAELSGKQLPSSNVARKIMEH